MRPNWDKIGANMNAIRTRTLIDEADVVVVRFGEKYRQWNAAFDAGYAAAHSKPTITLHPPAISHMLKEVNASAMAVCEEPEQVVQILDYTLTGRLPKPKDGDAFVPIVERLGKGKSESVSVFVCALRLASFRSNRGNVYARTADVTRTPPRTFAPTPACSSAA